MKRLAYIFLLLHIVAQPSHADNNKIIKWVDKDGVTHYGDKPPMPDAASKASVLNKEGIVVKKIQQEQIDHEAEQIAAQLNRHDAALLATYNSVEEIDIAKERNTRIDLITLENMQSQLASQKELQTAQRKKIAEFVRNRQPIPAELKLETKTTLADIHASEKAVASKMMEIAAIQKRYDDDKARFMELKPRDHTLVDLKSKRK